VVITADDPAWLASFTRELVEDRLAACGHLVESIGSTYWWEGAIQEDRESRVSLHTRQELVEEVVARATQRHPYSVPCVIALPIVAGNPQYIAWVMEETRPVGPEQPVKPSRDPSQGR
jgi:periplasmic divalent cation tolerance protein